MSVLVEAYTVIIQRSRLLRIHSSAVEQFFRNAPNRTARADQSLVGISFMHPEDVRIYIRTLEQEAGLRHIEDGRCIDIAVLDQARGLLAPCHWLDVDADDRGVAFCWLKNTTPGELATYNSWRWDGDQRMRHSSDPDATSAVDPTYRYHERTFGASEQRLVDGRDNMQRAAREAVFNEFRRRGWQSCAVMRASNPIHHLIFRRGNRLALIYVEADPETKLDARRQKRLVERARAWQAIPVLAVCKVFSPVWIADGQIKRFSEPSVDAIRLIDLFRRRALDERRFDDRERIAMSDWEVLDFAVQVVREKIEREGYTVEAWTSEPNDDPNVEATKDGQRYYVVVAAGRYPEHEPIVDRNRLVACAERAARDGSRLARATVSFASSDDMFVGDFPLPLWRGREATIRFQGLDFLEPEGVTANREVRVFISSTFEDFRAEREALLRRVFRELNRRAQERDVWITAIDLQWGVTDSEARDNLQLDACFREIDRCSPFLIGLLGERYGWCPPIAAIEKAGAPNEWRNFSITEMEIRRAAIPNFFLNRSALIYVRKPYGPALKRRQKLASTIARVPTRKAQLRLLKQHGLYTGDADDDGSYAKRSPPRHSKRPFEGLLLDLIDRGVPTHLLGRDFEQRVAEDLWALISKHFPDDTDHNPANRLARRHRRFGFAQAQAFDPNWPTLQSLADAARGMEQLRAVFDNSWEATGVAGVLAAQTRSALGDTRVFEHHCGLGPASSRSEELLGALIEHLGVALDQRTTIPMGNLARCALLAQLLQQAANVDAPPTVVVISEAELLHNSDVDVLSILRASRSTRLIEICTGLEGGAIRAWSAEERRGFLSRTIRRGGRALEQADVNSVVNHPMASDLLFLRFISSFLAHWASHQTFRTEFSRVLGVETWRDVAELVRVRGAPDDSFDGEALRVLAGRLRASPDGVDPAQLIEEAVLSGRALIEGRSRMDFLLTEWSGLWKLGRGLGTARVVEALSA